METLLTGPLLGSLEGLGSLLFPFRDNEIVHIHIGVESTDILVPGQATIRRDNGLIPFAMIHADNVE